jgi:hypothetical protein
LIFSNSPRLISPFCLLSLRSLSLLSFLFILQVSFPPVQREREKRMRTLLSFGQFFMLYYLKTKDLNSVILLD